MAASRTYAWEPPVCASIQPVLLPQNDPSPAKPSRPLPLLQPAQQFSPKPARSTISAAPPNTGPLWPLTCSKNFFTRFGSYPPTLAKQLVRSLQIFGRIHIQFTVLQLLILCL